MDENVEYSGFWIRVLASLIDTVWLVIVIYLVLTVFLGSTVSLGGDAPIAQTLIENLAPAVLIIGFWIVKSATPGKMLLGMKIVDAKTFGVVPPARLLLRYLGYIVSTIPFLLGLFWVGWDKRKQGWHDKIAGTVVVKGSSLSGSDSAQSGDDSEPGDS